MICVFQKLELINNTQTFNYWQQIPTPLYMSVYLFNWTNPEETLQNRDKPKLEQLGPYVFKYKIMYFIEFNL